MAEPTIVHEMAAARAALVAELQAEFFADDLVPPDRSVRWSDADLRRFFETGGEWRPRLLPPPLGRKARVALLHGTASNAKILRVQLGRLTARLERDGVCDPIVTVQGSLPCSDDNKMVDLMRTFFPGEPLFQYAVPSLDADERRTYDDVPGAAAKIEAELRAAAPIDAIIGFSQGANMATILAARAHARADGALDPPPRCVALLLPSRPGWPRQCDGAFGSDAAVRRVPIPALIVDGATDAMQEGAASEISDLFSTVERHTHPEGHRPLPADREAADMQARRGRRIRITARVRRPPALEA